MSDAEPPKARGPTVLRMTLRERIDDLLLRELGCEESELTPKARIREDLGADSLDAVELVMNLEEEFDLPEIAAEAVDKMLTVKDVYAYVEGQMKKKR